MEKWLDRLFAFEVDDENDFYEALAEIDTNKMVADYRPMTAINFADDPDMVVFMLGEPDDSAVMVDPSSLIALLDGDSRADEIREWIDEHTPETKMSVFYSGQIWFADQETFDAVEAALAAKVDIFVQPPYIWEPETPADCDDASDVTTNP